MKKLVGVSLEHNKQKLLVKIGATTGTVDPEFEVHRAYYKNMVETFKNINNQIEKQIRLASFAPNLSSLSESVSQFYGDDITSSQTALQYRTTTEQSRRAIADYLENHTNLVKNVQSSQQILTDLKIRIHDRDEALVHYDLRRNKLHSLQEKSQKDPNHNKIKLENAEKKYDLSKEKYEMLNEQLIKEIAQLYERKHIDFEPAFKSLVTNQQNLFHKLTDAYYTVYSFMSGNSEEISTHSSSSYTTATSSILSSENSVIAKSQDEPVHVVAIYDYVAKEPNELSFKEHDIITIMDKSSASGWFLGELNGQRGLFPSNFTEPMKEKAVKRESVVVVTMGTATALYDFPGREDGELPFKAGDVIQLTKKIEEGGWWKGECNGKSGIFPSNFVRENISSVGPSTAGQDETPRELVKAMFDYKEMEEGELSFKTGDVIEVIAKLQPNGWWKGKLNGKIGIFASNFVEKIDDE